MRATTLPVKGVQMLALGAVLAIGGCASGGGELRRPEVTRFHLGQQIARAEIAVEPRPGTTETLEFRTYADIVSGELARAGFRPTATVGRSEQVAVVDVTSTTRDLVGRGSGLSIGLGGATGGRSVGVGGGVSIPIGGKRTRQAVATELSVQIKRRSDGTVVWEGRAVGEARVGTSEAAPAEQVRRLAAALFQGFPGESGRTITVE